MEDAIHLKLRPLPVNPDMNRYQATLASLRQKPRTWLVTGVAGFIGSNLLECLLRLGQAVVGLDNFSTGHPKNIDEALERGGIGAKFRLIYGDVRDLNVCRDACNGVDIVLHQAALSSVPDSIDDPIASHDSNATGLANMLVASRDAKVQRFVYASSSAVYGDDPTPLKREDRIGEVLSPYAATMLIDEIYAGVFARVYGLQTIGLRYFSVFGKRQDPQGPQAAVIPQWLSSLAVNKPCVIMGDGETCRDFIHIEDAVQANLLAATVEENSASGQVYNVACGRKTTLNELYTIIRDEMIERRRMSPPPPVFEDFRPGDIRQSVADLSRIRHSLGYAPTRTIPEGIREAISWYLANDTPTRPQKSISLEIPSPPPLSLVFPHNR